MTLASRADASEGVLRFTVPRLNGEPDDLARYRGEAVPVVNTGEPDWNLNKYLLDRRASGSWSASAPSPSRTMPGSRRGSSSL